MCIDAKWFQAQFRDLRQVILVARGDQKWVFTAVHVTDGHVILKVIAPQEDAERLRLECLAVQQIRSAHVPAIHDLGTLNTNRGTIIWLREQWIPGENLRCVIRRVPLGASVARRLALHLLEALGDCERARIVHRDVKPENILMDMRGTFWLLDFDVAFHVGLGSLTASAAKTGWGTLGYASPEQLTDVTPGIDARADLFSLGVTLYEACTGQHPLLSGACNGHEVVDRTLSMSIPRMRLAWDQSGAFADLVFALTRRQREQRPPTAASALERAKRMA